ncbi:AfsR/SARP family transcriptional regulator [Streptomyces echinatus]|uniref:AfsR/SARP family transcriptional regulator n=1 Tax=Streptomyces echinatus TaxID=67293 RepID=UPI0037F2FFD7
MLGALEVRCRGTRVDIGGPKQRMFLLSLLLHVNQPVSLSWLTDALWDGEPPVSATANLRTYAMSLRRVLVVLDDVRLTTRDAAYQLDASADRIDMTGFRRLAAEGRRALRRGDFRAAEAHLREAASLWRHPPTNDLRCGKPLRMWLELLAEQYLAVLEEHAEARLTFGQYDDVVMDMRVLVGREPLRERAWALLMRALYGAGNTAGALAAYASARDELMEALGIEPGEELRALQGAVLRRDLAPARPVVARGRWI